MKHQEMVLMVTLLVVITELPHKTLQREGDNLHYELYVSMPDAILGSAKELKTVLKSQD